MRHLKIIAVALLFAIFWIVFIQNDRDETFLDCVKFYPSEDCYKLIYGKE